MKSGKTKLANMAVAIIAWLLVAEAGCVTYRAKPLTGSAVAGSFTQPSMAALQVEAMHIKHPILRPVELDEQNGLTPEEAAVLAVLINPGLRAERDKKGVSAAELFQAKILPNPQLSGSLDFPYAGATQGTVTAYGLHLDYDVYSLITKGAEINAARLHGSSVALDVSWQEWQVAEAAKLHTYRLYLLEKQLGIAKDEEKGLQENLDAVKRAVDLGDMTIIDLSAAQASLEKVHLSVLGIEQTLDQERFAVLNSIGLEPGRPIRLRQTIELPEVSTIPPFEDLMNGIADRRLDLMALKIGYKSQEERLRAAVLGQFPKITTGFSQARDNTNVVSGGLSITVGLPFFDRNQGQIAIQRATRQQLFDEYVSRFFEAQSDIAKLRADIESISSQIKATEAYLPTQKELVETYHNALLQGNADVLSYYNARDELIATHISLLNLQLQLIDRFMALEIASGEYLWQA
ncbi:MAG: TolC family protein [Syntrophobacteraceae bacterium]